ncbi:MAG: GNAT family N-acetyltransferase [Natronohydrobacter sp.]|nr:GNAT family N-acetyltransferase [Natronohydrobacter sp.]
MILVIDAINRQFHSKLLEDMFRLRARVFADRLGWDVHVERGMEIDEFDALDPVYLIGLDETDTVVSCVRLLQTTGPHMLSDVFSDILQGQAPLRAPTLWESTRFCVDTERLGLTDRGPGSVARATSELMSATLDYARRCGITDIITVIDPVMNRVLKRSDNAPYDYVGNTVQMGKTKAMAALLDCTPERIERVRAFAGIDYDVLVDEPALLQRIAQSAGMPVDPSDALAQYFIDQFDKAQDADELEATLALADAVLGKAKPVQSVPVANSVSAPEV